MNERSAAHTVPWHCTAHKNVPHCVVHTFEYEYTGDRLLKHWRMSIDRSAPRKLVATKRVYWRSHGS